MIDFAFFDVALACSGICVLYALTARRTRSKQPPLPPGPKPKPVIGNLLDFPKAGEPEWLHWTKHKELYGPISSVSLFGQHVIILNDLKLAFELLDKKSTIFSGRPVLPFAGVMCGYENALAMLPYGDRFRVLRRYLHQYMGSNTAMTRHHPLQEAETRQFLLRLLRSPETLPDQIRSATGSIILKLSHGYTTEKSGPDPLVKLADDSLSEFSMAAQPGSWMVDVMPFLQHVPDWFPGAGFKHVAKKWRKNLDTIVDLPHAFVKDQLASGTYFPSFTSAFLEDGVKNEYEDYVLKWAAFAIYGGGADTTVSALYGFFLAMVLHPGVQKAAQEELDRVVGTDRLPSFADRVNLPYIDALVKETLRWCAVVPLSIPHCADADTVYDGYLLPKGSIILPNIWYFNHDPETYHDPMTFKPERFLGDKPEYDPHNIAFGFGRRICPGKELADTSLFISIAMVLAVFKISKAKDTNGDVVEPVVEYTCGVISHPKEYRCSVIPRSDKAAALIDSLEDEASQRCSDAEALAHVKID